MAFPRKYLKDDEDILLDLHPHWWSFAAPLLATIAASALVVAVAQTDLGDDIPVWAAPIFPGLALLWLFIRWLSWVTTNFVLTTDRLVHRQGVLAKHQREIPLERVNDITCQQSVFERIVGAGDLVIESGGERGQQSIGDLPKPFRVQNAIYHAIEDSGARDAARHVGERALSIPEQIEKLDELRQRGVISQAEFDAKKAQLLDRI